MISYTIKRLMGIIIVLFVAASIMFVITQLAPGSPVYLFAGENPSPGMIEEIKERWGLNDPIHIQLFRYLLNVVQLDMGTSMVTRRPISEDIRIYLPATLELTFVSIIIGTFFGVLAAVISVKFSGKIIDHLIRTFSLIGVSTPIFWLGLLLLLFFYLQLNIFPGGGRLSLGLRLPRSITGLFLLDSILLMEWQVFRNALWHIILPSICLAFASSGRIARIARASMLNVYKKDYVRVARAKGLKEKTVLMKHVFKNSLISTLTMVGEVFGVLMGGSVLTETIFSWPGLGRYAVQSAMALDYLAITGYAVVATFFFALANLIIDLSYGFVDPRIKYS